jgi:hypothetical protein
MSGELFGPSEGAAVLDIGGDIGAAVVHTTAALEGVEIEITPDGADWDGTHVAVRRRIGTAPEAEPIFCAIFSRLHEGVYRVRVKDDAQPHPWPLVKVRAARVAHVKLVDPAFS